MRMGAYDERNQARIGVLSSPKIRVGVTRLAVTDFRNYRSARLDLDAGTVVLTGPDGAGKTNLLEAVSFLSPRRRLRQGPWGEMARRAGPPPLAPANGGGRGGGGWAVAPTVATRRGTVRIGTGREPEGG